MGNSISIIRSKRGQLNKQGKAVLDAFVESCLKLDLTHEERAMVLSLKMTELVREYPMPPIRLIKFEDFVGLKTFPRYPDNKDLCVDLDKIDRNNSFLVFISHCWLRGYSGAEGWDGRPHPDNAAGDKYELCVKGIKELKNSYAPRMSECYVWLDYGCINQDGNPAGELEQLDKIVQCCDCIFTPIVDKEHSDWEYSSQIANWFDEYPAKLWNDGPYAYLNRGWCRVEMLYAANIPVQENTGAAGTDNSEIVPRHKMFESGLAFHCSQSRRPHFLYGTKESEGVRPPVLLPPLQYSYLNFYNPMEGNLSVASDVEHIQALMAELRPYMDAKAVVMGYKGSRNEQGQRHGRGTYRFANGAVYEGEWKHDMTDGYGIYRYADGDVYEGEWKKDMRHGKGIYRLNTGGVYEGQWDNDMRDGQGINRSANGNVYEGGFCCDAFDGYGILQSADGDVYEGEFCDNEFEGVGTMRYADGSVYIGEWKSYMRHGHGKYCSADGVESEGEWLNDEPASEQ